MRNEIKMSTYIKKRKQKSVLLYRNMFDTVVSVEVSFLLPVAVVVIILLPSLVVSFEAFIKLIVGLLEKTAGGGGNDVGNCAGWDIIPVALFVIYIEFAEYIAFAGEAKSICFYVVVTKRKKIYIYVKNK